MLNSKINLNFKVELCKLKIEYILKIYRLNRLKIMIFIYSLLMFLEFILKSSLRILFLLFKMLRIYTCKIEFL